MSLEQYSNFTGAKRWGRPLRNVLLAAVSLASLCQATAIQAAELWPQTKVRLTVIQWVPMSGVYERWDAFSGDFTVSGDGTMPLPVIGRIPTRDKSSDQIALEVAAALKEHLGLVNAPETSIEVLSYPPVYVVGDVSTPGAFEFRQGMTVLQAFALGGGERQSQAQGISAQRVRLSSELRSIDDGLLRTRARIARLTAEVKSAEEIVFPEEVTGHPNIALAQSVMKDEEMIFLARQREVVRQTEALDDLAFLLNREIETLRARLIDVDKIIATSSEELSGVQSLVDKGLATASRRSELERKIADLRFEQLTQTTSVLRAQQALSQAQREAAQLEDSGHTQAAVAMQDEQAKVDQMLLQQSTSQRLLLDIDTGPESTAGQPSRLNYLIVRQSQGPVEISADETTALLPGDVLKVVTQVSPPADMSLGNMAQAKP